MMFIQLKNIVNTNLGSELITAVNLHNITHFSTFQRAFFYIKIADSTEKYKTALEFEERLNEFVAIFKHHNIKLYDFYNGVYRFPFYVVVNKVSQADLRVNVLGDAGIFIDFEQRGLGGLSFFYKTKEIAIRQYYGLFEV